MLIGFVEREPRVHNGFTLKKKKKQKTTTPSYSLTRVWPRQVIKPTRSVYQSLSGHQKDGDAFMRVLRPGRSRPFFKPQPGLLLYQPSKGGPNLQLTSSGKETILAFKLSGYFPSW